MSPPDIISEDSPDFNPLSASTVPRSDQSWPALRALMDEAISSDRGIRIPFHSWNRANSIRNQLGKLRQIDRSQSRRELSPADPGFGSSVYDALTFVVESRLGDVDLKVDFHFASGTYPKQLGAEVQDLIASVDYEAIPPDIFRTPIEHLPAFYSTLLSTCTIKAVNKAGRILIAAHAPSFKMGWDILRKQLPAWLRLENRYVIRDDMIERL